MRARGFTLVEVLVATAITVVVAAAAYAGINAVVAGAGQLREAGDRTREVNRALALIGRDLRQFVDRPVRDEFGARQPALAGGELAPFPLSLTRDGWHNSLQQPRSDLQRVHYYLEEGALWRAYQVSVDLAIDAQLLRVRLLDGVEEMELRFLDRIDSLRVDRSLVVDTRDWARSWIADPAADGALPPPPVALEIRLELADVGTLRRLYELPVR